MKTPAYSPEVEARMLDFYTSLSEKDRRRYAAIEADKLGRGGIRYREKKFNKLIITLRIK